MFRQHPLLSAATFLYLGFVAWITLGPQPLQSGAGDDLLWRALHFFGRHELLAWLNYTRIEFLANVAMFVPVGMFFLLLFGRRFWFVSVLAGVALTCGIEFVQQYIPSRVSDVSDIIANSAGTLVGVVLALALTWRRARQIAKARRQAAVRQSHDEARRIEAIRLDRSRRDGGRLDTPLGGMQRGR